ncbi:MAG TPA: Na/Pi cotransporter family protein [Deltaproteobacteria bacterium]|nr:Na/Pi cotransporter family protein [Deltaproteobacteria bacterium]
MNAFSIIAGLIGGLGLFIYGMHLMSDSLRKLSLGLLRSLLEKITSNRIKSMFVGAFVTALIQSSSATSVILIGFLNAGFLTLGGGIAIMIGANVGTTITAQLIAFKLTALAPIFVFGGAVYYLFTKKDKNKYRGLAVLGFGMLFLGLAMMSMAVMPFSENESVKNAFLSFGKYPFLGILTGLVLTMAWQSSSTTTGMVIAFASAGLLDLASAIYIIFGMEIGTCITAVLASIGGKIASKRLALSHTIFNVLGVLFAVAMAPLYLKYVPMLSDNIARQVANTHTLFNVFNALIFLTFVPLLKKLVTIIIPGEDYVKKETRHLDNNLLSLPHLAIRAVIKEMVAMLDICVEMLKKARKCTIAYNHKLRNEISLDEESVDEMQKNITEYLVEITKHELPEKHSRLIPALLHSVNDLEKVGDYCEGIVILAQRAFENNLAFSDEAAIEIEKLFEKTETLMKQTRKAMQDNDQTAALITLNIEKELDELINQYKLNHIKRLENNICISNAGLVFTDILTDLERLNDHLCNITKGILHLGKR